MHVCILTVVNGLRQAHQEHDGQSSFSRHRYCVWVRVMSDADQHCRCIGRYPRSRHDPFAVSPIFSAAASRYYTSDATYINTI